MLEIIFALVQLRKGSSVVKCALKKIRKYNPRTFCIEEVSCQKWNSGLFWDCGKFWSPFFSIHGIQKLERKSYSIQSYRHTSIQSNSDYHTIKLYSRLLTIDSENNTCDVWCFLSIHISLKISNVSFQYAVCSSRIMIWFLMCFYEVHNMFIYLNNKNNSGPYRTLQLIQLILGLYYISFIDFESYIIHTLIMYVYLTCNLKLFITHSNSNITYQIIGFFKFFHISNLR